MKTKISTRASVALAGALSLTLWLTGCGGGGGGSSSSPSGNSRVAVLLTDSFREDFAHVWATIYRAELIGESGSPVVVFDDPAGHPIDLKTLRDASGERFSFLSSAAVPAGTYTGVSVTVAPTMQLFRGGAAVGDPLPVDSAIPTDASGNAVLGLTFASPKTVDASGAANVVIDFDLARFVVRQSGILPAIKEGTTDGLNNKERHNDGDYHGKVSGLTGTAPDLTFTLTQRDGTTVTVGTSAATALYGRNALADGAIVEVEGTLDPTTQTLVATNIEVRPSTNGVGGDASRAPRIAGTASALNADAGTFTVAAKRACVITPGQRMVTVATNASTVFRADDGTVVTQAEFFAALAATPGVIAVGAYDAASNTITAATVKVEDHSQDGGWNRSGNQFRKGSDRDRWGQGVLRRDDDSDDDNGSHDANDDSGKRD